MASVSNEQNLLKRLLTAVSIAKEIVHLSYKIDENQAILSEMRSYYDTINGILKYDYKDYGFLGKAVILARLSPLGASEAHIVAMVNIINISLAIYKVFLKTQLRTVLKSLFINIVPSVMDISGGVGPAYQALLHTAFMEIESRSHRNRLEKLWCRAIRKYVPVLDDMNADNFYHLMQFENGCLDNIREEIPPVGADEFTTLWIAAILSMVSQSMDVSSMMESIPEYLVNLSNEIVEPETEVEPEDDDMFYDSVSFQSDDDELFVDSVAYQQPTTPPPPFSSSNSEQAPINSATSRKRKNPFDSELPDDFSQSQSLSTEPEEAQNKKRKTVNESRLRQLLKRWF